MKLTGSTTMGKLLMMVFITLVSMNLSAQENPNLAKAKEYFRLYEKFEFEKLGELLADSVVLQDDTFEAWFNRLRIKGKDNLIKTLKEGFQGYHDFKYEIKSQWATTNFVVTSGINSSSPEGRLLGVPAINRFNFKYDFCIILEFNKDGKIIIIHDYLNQEQTKKQMADQMKGN